MYGLRITCRPDSAEMTGTSGGDTVIVRYSSSDHWCLGDECRHCCGDELWWRCCWDQRQWTGVGLLLGCTTQINASSQFTANIIQKPPQEFSVAS